MSINVPNITANILIVDDDSAVLKTIKDIVISIFPQTIILTASNGHEALNIFNKHKVSLVITDINMPIMTGIKLIEEIKKNPFGVPCIALSAETYKLAALEAKADKFIAKPFSATYLIDVIIELL